MSKQLMLVFYFLLEYKNFYFLKATSNCSAMPAFIECAERNEEIMGS
jgi:hypothetical protein